MTAITRTAQEKKLQIHSSNTLEKKCDRLVTCKWHFLHYLIFFHSFLFSRDIVEPTSINITSKPKHFASEIEYSINCEVDGSIPDTEIRWTQNNRPFKRGKVSKMHPFNQQLANIHRLYQISFLLIYYWKVHMSM